MYGILTEKGTTAMLKFKDGDLVCATVGRRVTDMVGKIIGYSKELGYLVDFNWQGDSAAEWGTLTHYRGNELELWHGMVK